METSEHKLVYLTIFNMELTHLGSEASILSLLLVLKLYQAIAFPVVLISLPLIMLMNLQTYQNGHHPCS